MLAVFFNLLLPGLGHAYVGKLGRGLIWAAGALAIGLVIEGGATEPPTWARVVLPAVLAVCSAVDIAALMRMEGTSRDAP